MKKIMGLCLIAVIIPYIVTLAWTGRVEGNIPVSKGGKKTIMLDRGTSPSAVDLEAYLIGVTAMQIPAGYEMETLKAQAIIARTYLYKQMGEKTEIAESEIDLNYLETGQMEEMWGKENYLEYYKKLRDAAAATKGQVLQYDGTYIDPLFHRVSAGMTRKGDDLHPYIQAVDGHLDVGAENYMSITTFSEADFASKLNSMSDSPGLLPDKILTNIQIVEKDEAGYVNTVQAGTKSYSGEDMAYALGLPSSAFSFENYEGAVRCTVKGIGHGYGFDQYGADLKAGEGWKAEELLQFYYKNILIIFE